MNMLSMQASILAQDAFLKALALTRRDPDKLQKQFSDIWTQAVWELNKSGQAELAKKLHEAAGSLMHFAR
jgi:hypothetical protein